MRGFRMGGAGGKEKENYIYKNGDLKVPFSNYSYKASFQGSSQTGKVGSLTNTNNRLRFTLPQTALNQLNVTSFFSDPIDFTNINSITINITASSYSDNRCFMGFVDNVVNNYTLNSYKGIGKVGIHTVDTTGITGVHRLAINMDSYYSTAVNAYIETDAITLN